jgi:hypothetical protein
MSATGPQVLSVNCPSCGKVLRVPGDRAGKLAKCPGCMNTFTVPGGSGGPAAAGAVRLPGQGRPGAAGPRKESTLAVSPTLVTFGAVALVVVGGILAFVWGPLAVKGEWERMEPAARDVSEDVVVRGLDAYLSANQMIDPSKGREMSGTRNFMFSPPLMVMSMPERVKFDGTSTQGMFKGFYHPRTGEVEADVEVGGTVLPSGVTVRHGGTIIHVTGREKEGKLSVEVDGKPGEIVNWRKQGEG